MKPICVLIPHYKRSEELVRCVESLQSLNDQSLFDVLIVDDASPNAEETGATLGKIVAQSKEKGWNNVAAFIRNVNGGFTQNVNSGIRFLQNITYTNSGNGYKYVMLLNNDAVFAKQNGLKELIDAFDDPLKVGITMQNAGCWCQDSIWPTRMGEKEPFRKDLQPMEARRELRSQFPDLPAWYEDHVGFWGTMIRLDMFEKFGLFNEDFKIVCQDTDFCWRLAKYGYKTKVVGSHIIGHTGKTHIDLKPKEEINENHDKDQGLIRDLWPEKYQ